MNHERCEGGSDADLAAQHGGAVGDAVDGVELGILLLHEEVLVLIVGGKASGIDGDLIAHVEAEGVRERALAVVEAVGLSDGFHGIEAGSEVEVVQRHALVLWLSVLVDLIDQSVVVLVEDECLVLERVADADESEDLQRCQFYGHVLVVLFLHAEAQSVGAVAHLCHHVDAHVAHDFVLHAGVFAGHGELSLGEGRVAHSHVGGHRDDGGVVVAANDESLVVIFLFYLHYYPCITSHTRLSDRCK